MTNEEPKKRTIFDIQWDYLRIYEDLLENGGELTPEMEQCLDSLAEELPAKLEALLLVMRDAEGEADKISLLLKPLQDRKARYVKTAARIKRWVIRSLEIAEMRKIKTPHRLFEPALRRNPIRVEILDEHRPIPLGFAIPQPPKLNQLAIREYLKQSFLPEHEDRDTFSEELEELNVRVIREHGLRV